MADLHVYTEVESALIHATELGDLKQVEELLSQGGNANTINKFHQNLLFLACLHGHAKLAFFLLDHGGEVCNSKKRPYSRLLQERKFLHSLERCAEAEFPIEYSTWDFEKLTNLIKNEEDIGLGEELLNTARLKGYTEILDYLNSPMREFYKRASRDDFVNSAFNAACSSGNLSLIEPFLDLIKKPEYECLKNAYGHKFWFYPCNLHVLKFFLEKKFITENDLNDLPLRNFKNENYENLLSTVSSFYNISKEDALGLFDKNLDFSTAFAPLINELDLSKLSPLVLQRYYIYFEWKESREICEKIVALVPDLKKKFVKKFKRSGDGINWKILEKTLFQITLKDLKRYAQEHPETVCCSFIIDANAHYGYVDVTIINFQDICNMIGSSSSRTDLGDIIKKFHSIVEYKKAAESMDYPPRILNLIEEYRRESADFSPINSEESQEKWKRFQEALEEAGMKKNGKTVKDRFLDVCCRVAIRLQQEGALDCLQREPDFEIIVKDHDEPEDESLQRMSRVSDEMKKESS